jgi:hypothetical protein
MIICHFSDGFVQNVDETKFNNYLELKKYLFNLKSKTLLNKSDDITLITYGKIINDNDTYVNNNNNINQVYLVKINIDIEVLKIINDSRLINLVSNEKTRNYMYKILENPDLLNFLDTYKYQKELDNIKDMNFSISDDKIKEFLNSSNGNIEIVISSILNL